MQPILDYHFEDFIGVFKVDMDCESVIEYFEYLTQANSVCGVPDHQKDYRKDSVVYVQDLDIKYRSPFFDEYNRITWDCMSLYVEEFSYFDPLHNLQQATCKIQKTLPGGGYHLWHSENHTYESRYRGLVSMVYLNDVEEGGETEFLYYSKRIKPERGKFLLFPAGFTHTHRGNPPLSGKKYIATSWIEHKA